MIMMLMKILRFIHFENSSFKGFIFPYIVAFTNDFFSPLP